MERHRKVNPLDEPHAIKSVVSVTDRANTPALLAVYVLIVFSIILFLAGFIAGEDGFGGMVRGDLYLFHGPTMWAFRNKPFFSVLPDYRSATTPLFQILESFNPLLGHDIAFRATNTLFALGTYWLFVIAMRRRFSSIPTARIAALTIASSMLLSPYFRAESYWVSTDVFPVFIIIVTGILVSPVQDNDSMAEPVIKAWSIIPLLALVSWSCFYCRQTDIFLPLYVFLILLFRFRNYRWIIVLLFGVLGLPAVYLVRLWKGFTPPSFRHHQGFSFEAIIPPLSMVLIYAIPFLLEIVFWERERLFAFATKFRYSWLYILAGWLCFLALFHSFQFNDRNEGGGIASRLLARHGDPGRYVFLTLSYLGFLIVLLLCRQASWKGRVLLASFMLPAIAMTVFFQRYYDPVLVVVFFLLWERETVARFMTVRTGLLLMAFNTALLSGALVYNGRNKPVFMPLFFHPKPWTEITPY